MGRSQDCGMSPYVNAPQNFLAVGNASEPAGSVLHRSSWMDAVLIGNFLSEAEWSSLNVDHWTNVPNYENDIDTLEAKMEQTLTDEILMNIFGEAVDFIPRFENVCLYDGHSHPKTYRLTQTVSQIGWFVVQHFKSKLNRPRPSFLEPMRIRPLIKVPSHPSYPSGHATQSKLVGLALIAAMGAKATPDYQARIKEVYDDIGENRERAGVHYPTDTSTGQQLADDIYGLIIAESGLQALMQEAQAEWI